MFYSVWMGIPGGFQQDGNPGCCANLAVSVGRHLQALSGPLCVSLFSPLPWFATFIWLQVLTSFDTKLQDESLITWCSGFANIVWTFWSSSPWDFPQISPRCPLQHTCAQDSKQRPRPFPSQIVSALWGYGRHTHPSSVSTPCKQLPLAYSLVWAQKVGHDPRLPNESSARPSRAGGRGETWEGGK